MTVEKDKYVTINYNFRTQDGQLLGSSEHQGPLTYCAGVGEIIPGLDKQILGKAEGEELKFTVPPEEAYGSRDEALVAKLPRTDLPKGVEPKLGMRLDTKIGDRWYSALVSEIRDSDVTVDANHPLAGVSLNFECSILSVSDEAPASSCGCGSSGGCSSGGCGDGGCGSDSEACSTDGCGSGCGCH